MDKKLQLGELREIDEKFIRERSSYLNADKSSKTSFKKEVGALARRTHNIQIQECVEEKSHYNW